MLKLDTVSLIRAGCGGKPSIVETLRISQHAVLLDIGSCACVSHCACLSGTETHCRHMAHLLGEMVLTYL